MTEAWTGARVLKIEGAGGSEIFLEMELTRTSDGLEVRSERNGRIQGVSLTRRGK